jgi:hypothetical protein
VFTELTMKQKNKYLAQSAAWTYLVASCSGKAFGLIERHTGDPFKSWGVLEEKFCATDVEANYPEIEKEFQNSKLEGTARDPELWFNDLDHFNVRLGRISRDLVKSELQLKSHMMANMSSAYDAVVMKFRGERVETSIEKLQKEILMHYKFLLSTGKVGIRVQTVHAMMVASENMVRSECGMQCWRHTL